MKTNESIYSAPASQICVANPRCGWPEDDTRRRVSRLLLCALGHLSISIMNMSASGQFMLKSPGAKQIPQKDLPAGKVQGDPLL